jgi:membrane protein YqaA with SNARE-associated domain
MLLGCIGGFVLGRFLGMFITFMKRTLADEDDKTALDNYWLVLVLLSGLIGAVIGAALTSVNISVAIK